MYSFNQKEKLIKAQFSNVTFSGYLIAMRHCKNFTFFIPTYAPTFLTIILVSRSNLQMKSNRLVDLYLRYPNKMFLQTTNVT